MRTSTVLSVLVLVVASQPFPCCSGQPRDRFAEEFGKGIGSHCLIEMHNAVYDDNSVKLVKILEEDKNKECDINEIIPDGSGQTLIMNAVLTGKSDEILMALLDHGADVTIGEKDGFTPIHGAAFQGRASAVKVLVEHPNAKMDVNARHKDGFAPIHRACWGRERRHTDTVKRLLQYGADPTKPFCRRSFAPDGKVIETCKPLTEMTNNVDTRKVLESVLKAEEAQDGDKEL